MITRTDEGEQDGMLLIGLILTLLAFYRWSLSRRSSFSSSMLGDDVVSVDVDLFSQRWWSSLAKPS